MTQHWHHAIDREAVAIEVEQLIGLFGRRMALRSPCEHKARIIQREDIEREIERLICILDVMDGDADLEESDAEDSFLLPNSTMHRVSGPGCDIADGCDFAWPEQDAGGEQLPGRVFMDALHDRGLTLIEDEEPEEDRCTVGDDGCGPYPWRGKVHWGSDLEELSFAGRYPIDQSRGAIGAGTAHRCHA